MYDLATEDVDESDDAIASCNGEKLPVTAPGQACINYCPRILTAPIRDAKNPLPIKPKDSDATFCCDSHEIHSRTVG